MLSVAIVDDMPQMQEHLKKCLEYLAEKKNLQIQISQFSSGKAFLWEYQPEYDIVLMDVEMPELSGIETAKALRELDQTVLLVFVTNFAQYALRGYEVDAISYIMKPVNPYDFALKMERVLSRTNEFGRGSIQIKTDDGVLRIRTSSILYCEVFGHYVIYHTTEGNYTEYTTLKEAEQKINSSHFAQPHRCYLVNLKYVSRVAENVLYSGKDEIPLAKARQKAFLEAFAQYIGGVR